MPTPTVINQYRYSDAISRREWDQKYFFDQFNDNPVTAAVGGGAASGTAGHQNVLYTQNGAYEWNVIGTQTILAPSLDAFGLNLVQDAAVAGDGSEVCLGQNALCPAAFVVGTDAAFFMRCQFKVQDASGINPLIIGFRKVQAFNATLTTYTDYATIGIVGTANPNTIKTETQVGSAGNVLTDTTQTWADGEVHYLAVFVSSTGVVTYQIDGQAPIASVPYTFTSGLQVMPFIRQVQAADLTTQVSIDWLEVGLQS